MNVSNRTVSNAYLFIPQRLNRIDARCFQREIGPNIAPTATETPKDESGNQVLINRLARIGIHLTIVSSLAALFSDDFPWLKSRAVNGLFLFLFGVVTGAFGLCMLQARQSRSNERRNGS